MLINECLIPITITQVALTGISKYVSNAEKKKVKNRKDTIVRTITREPKSEIVNSVMDTTNKVVKNRKDTIVRTINKKPQSGIVKSMMNASNIAPPLLAKCLGCEVQSLRNKFNRDSFSIDDLLTAAYVCDYDVILKKRDSEEAYAIDIKSYLESRGKEILERIENYKNEDYTEKRAEYDSLKARLAELEKEYKFEDL